MNGSAENRRQPLLSVAVPCYNEAATVEESIRRLAAVPLDMQIIAVDDGSTDGTWDKLRVLAEELGILVRRHQQNMGKGAAVRTALDAAEGRFFVIHDADLEYDPRDLPRLLEQAQRPDVLLVVGRRQFDPSAGGLLHRIARRLLSLAFFLLTGYRVDDIAACDKMAPTKAVRRARPRGRGFDMEFDMAVRLARIARRRGMKIVQVPIAYAPRTASAGKKIRWVDFWRALWAMLRARFSALEDAE